MKTFLLTSVFWIGVMIGGWLYLSHYQTTWFYKLAGAPVPTTAEQQYLKSVSELTTKIDSLTTTISSLESKIIPNPPSPLPLPTPTTTVPDTSSLIKL